jgi:hypothetical protein
MGKQIDLRLVDEGTLCQNGIVSQCRNDTGTQKYSKLSLAVAFAVSGLVEGGTWDPCFKAGPCPCPNPCKWVAELACPDAPLPIVAQGQDDTREGALYIYSLRTP